MPFWGKKKEEALGAAGAPQQENAGAESNVMGAEEGSGGALSALRENIKQKQGNAYYYAHATRDTGEAPAPMPQHVVLERTVSVQEETTEAISSYQMLDDEDLGVVKVYIPLAGIGSIAKDKEAPKKRVDPEVVRLDLTESSMNIEIRRYKPNTALKIRDTEGKQILEIRVKIETIKQVTGDRLYFRSVIENSKDTGMLVGKDI